jgi:hypothetical protein
VIVAAAAAADPSAEAASSQKVSVCYRARRAPGIDPLRFADTTEAAAITRSVRGWYGHATAVGDVDGDGWTDLFFGGFADKTLATNGDRVPDRLLLGGPDGFRVDDTFSVEAGRTAGAAFADLDADGDLDLVLSRNVRDAPGGRAPSVVLRNDDGVLTQARVLDASRSARSIGVLDYDRDGRLDLFLAADRLGGGSSALLRNEGGLRFSDVTADAGLPAGITALGVAAADLSDDGWPDLFVGGSNRLFVNGGRGSFREADSSVFQWERFGDEDDPAGVATGDVDRDGRPDLVIGQHYNSTVDDGTRVPVRLYLNGGNDRDGAPRFRDVTDASGLAALPTKAPHVEIADLDGDAWPDILTTASAADGSRPAVFHNRGSREGLPRFDAPGGLGSAQYWIAGATFDSDHDGDLDVFLVEFDPARSSVLLRNDAAGAHWLGVQVGRVGGAGVGTAVQVYRAGELGDRSSLLGTQEIVASTGFGSGATPVAHFGLGDESRVDVRITPVRAAEAAPAPTDLRRLRVDRLVAVSAAGACRG